MRIYTIKFAKTHKGRVAIAQYYFNMLTDTNYFNEDGTVNPNHTNGFNTIVTNRAQYSPKFSRGTLVIVGNSGLNADQLRDITGGINNHIGNLLSLHLKDIRPPCIPPRDYFGFTGWSEEIAIKDHGALENLRVVNNLTIVRDMSTTNKGYWTLDLLNTVVIDTDGIYTTDVNMIDATTGLIYDRPDPPLSGDLSRAQTMCPIPLMFNLYTGFTPEIFYYLVMTDTLSEKTANLLKSLQTTTVPDNEKHCSNHCKHSCVCSEDPMVFVGQRPIFPADVQRPTAALVGGAVYRRAKKVQNVAPSGKVGPDFTTQVLAKTRSVAGQHMVSVNMPSITWKEWGTFSYTKHDSHKSLADYFEPVAPVELNDSGSESVVHRCTLSGQPCFDDCYVITMCFANEQIANEQINIELTTDPSDVDPNNIPRTKSHTINLLICPFVAHHTYLIRELNKICNPLSGRCTMQISRTCAKQTFNDILDVYYVDEHPAYVDILRRAWYTTSRMGSDYLFVDEIQIAHTWNFNLACHAQLC